MTDPGEFIDDITPGPPADEQPAATSARRARPPESTLNLAMLVYIAVNLLLAMPLLIFPTTFFDFIGVDKVVADELDGMRWVGAILLAWAVSAILVLARPGGRAIFVTTGALQMSFAGLILLWSWSVDEFLGSLAYHAVLTVVTVATAVFMWWARLRGRKVLAGNQL